jgi:hypothetical protein
MKRAAKKAKFLGIGVGMPATLWLNEFGSQVWSAFGEPPYVVGSCLWTKREFRDVDVRLILDDEVYERMGFGNPKQPNDNGRWVAMCMAFSELGRKMTGLPIDFQIQQQSEANRLFPSAKNHLRCCIGLIELRFAKKP